MPSSQRYELHVETVLVSKKTNFSCCRVRCVPEERRTPAMAVYTDVAADDLADFLKSYDVGELLS